jgi:hypothetical protein
MTASPEPSPAAQLGPVPLAWPRWSSEVPAVAAFVLCDPVWFLLGTYVCTAGLRPYAR